MNRFLTSACRSSTAWNAMKHAQAWKPAENFLAKSCFHTSSIALRKSGSRSLEPATRLPSRKQAKRKSREIVKSSEIVDKKKEKNKIQHMRDQYSSEGVQTYIADMREKLKQPLMNEMLPDGLKIRGANSTMADQFENVDPMETLSRYEFLRAISSGTPASSTEGAAVDTTTTALSVVDEQTVEDGNISLTLLSSENKVDQALALYNHMKALSVPIETTSMDSLLKAAVKANKLAVAEEIFSEIVKDDHRDISLGMWSTRAEMHVRRGDRQGALDVLEKLQKLSIKPEPALYSIILRSYVNKKEFKKAEEMWHRMHAEDVSIDLAAFETMMHMCFLKCEAERALMYLDEMRVYNLEPTLTTFKELFMAVSTAPHHMPGFESSMFDAMAIMEGKELMPTTEIYESIIYAFGRARDPVAAEYYFWEMKRKGIKASVVVYENLFNAYMLAQTVGASSYGSLGRYSRPEPKKLSQKHQAEVDLGPVEVQRIRNSGVYTDWDFEPHGQRVKSPAFEDMHSGSEGEEALEQRIMDEASLAKRRRKEMALAQEAEEALYSSDSDGRPRLSAASHKAPQLGKGKGTTHYPSLQDEDDEEEDTWDAAGLERQFQQMAKFSRKSEADFNKAINEDRVGKVERKGQDKNEGEYDEEDDEEAAHLRSDGYYEEHGGAGTNEQYPEHNSLEDMTEKELFAVARQRIENLKTNTFEDPFSHMTDLKGKFERVETEAERDAAAEARLRAEEAERKVQMVALLDGDVSAYEKMERGALAVLSGEEKPSGLDGQSSVTESDIYSGFDLVYFGRPDNADYSKGLQYRRNVNMHRAELAFQDMLESGFKPSQRALTKLVGVYAEAGAVEKTEKALMLFEKFHQKLDAAVYNNVMMMHIRRKDVDGAEKMLATMKEANIVPLGNTYGTLISAYVPRGAIVEALKIVEDASANGVTIPEKQMKILRARCDHLGIKHPDIPSNPLQWVKDVKQMRRNLKSASQRVIEPMRSVR